MRGKWRRRSQRVLFIQFNPPGAYPPVIRAIETFLDSGVNVMVVGARAATNLDALTSTRTGVREVILPRVPNGPMQTFRFAAFTMIAVVIGLLWRADLVYASDPPASIPMVVLCCFRKRAVYHEHDAPSPTALNKIVRRFRREGARCAVACLVPNGVRSANFQHEIPGATVTAIPNYPSCSDVAPRPKSVAHPRRLYYHGSIVPERLPETVIQAMTLLPSDVTLHFAGYETEGGRGHVEQLLTTADWLGLGGRVAFLGSLSHTDAMRVLETAHVGLALVNPTKGDVNLTHLAGASVKVFEYMAKGVVPLVPNTTDWLADFVEPGLAVGCDPTSAESIALAIQDLYSAPETFDDIATRCVAKIQNEWNVERALRPVLEQLLRVDSQTG